MPARLNSVWEAIGDPLIITDSRQEIVVFNRAAEDVFGYSGSEVLGRQLDVLLPPRFRLSHRRHTDQFRSRGIGHTKGGSGRPTVYALRKNGEEFPAEVTLSTLQFEGEMMAAATVRDVSDRVAAERALAQSERRFRVAFEDSPVAFALVGMDRRLIDGNAALAALTGIPVEDMRGQRMPELVNATNIRDLTAALRPMLAGEASTVRTELHIVDPGGKPRVLDLFVALVVDDEGRPDYMISQASEITDRVRTQRQLEELLRSKDDLIASVSHELRTPLTAVVGFARLLQDNAGSLSTPEEKEMLDSIVSEATDLSDLVDDLLVAARAEMGALSSVRVPVDLHLEASRVLHSWRDAEVERVILEGTPVRALADPGRVRQILRNLVSNALRYGGDRIALRVEGNGEAAVVTVADDGHPIPPDDQDRIFERYQRAHTNAGVTASMGLGLSVARDLCQLMGGGLTYGFEAGENRFRLTLPRIPAP